MSLMERGAGKMKEGVREGEEKVNEGKRCEQKDEKRVKIMTKGKD